MKPGLETLLCHKLTTAQQQPSNLLPPKLRKMITVHVKQLTHITDFGIFDLVMGIFLLQVKLIVLRSINCSICSNYLSQLFASTIGSNQWQQLLVATIGSNYLQQILVATTVFVANKSSFSEISFNFKIKYLKWQLSF